MQYERTLRRNSHGHYLFTDENIQQLKQIQQQLNEGFVLQQVELGEKKTRKGAVKPIVQSPEHQYRHRKGSRNRFQELRKHAL